MAGLSGYGNVTQAVCVCVCVWVGEERADVIVRSGGQVKVVSKRAEKRKCMGVKRTE